MTSAAFPFYNLLVAGGMGENDARNAAAPIAEFMRDLEARVTQAAVNAAVQAVRAEAEKIAVAAAKPGPAPTTAQPAASPAEKPFPEDKELRFINGLTVFLVFAGAVASWGLAAVSVARLISG